MPTQSCLSRKISEKYEIFSRLHNFSLRRVALRPQDSWFIPRENAIGQSSCKVGFARLLLNGGKRTAILSFEAR